MENDIATQRQLKEVAEQEDMKISDEYNYLHEEYKDLVKQFSHRTGNYLQEELNSNE